MEKIKFCLFLSFLFVLMSCGIIQQEENLNEIDFGSASYAILYNKSLDTVNLTLEYTKSSSTSKSMIEGNLLSVEENFDTNINYTNGFSIPETLCIIKITNKTTNPRIETIILDQQPEYIGLNQLPPGWNVGMKKRIYGVDLSKDNYPIVSYDFYLVGVRNGFYIFEDTDTPSYPQSGVFTSSVSFYEYLENVLLYNTNILPILVSHLYKKIGQIPNLNVAVIYTTKTFVNGIGGYFCDETSISNGMLTVFVNKSLYSFNTINMVVAHELQHAFFWSISPYQPLTWFNEGLSEIISEVYIKDTLDPNYTSERAKLTFFDKLFGLGNVLNYETRGVGNWEQHIREYYKVYLYFVAWLNSDPVNKSRLVQRFYFANEAEQLNLGLEQIEKFSDILATVLTTKTDYSGPNCNGIPKVPYNLVDLLDKKSLSTGVNNITLNPGSVIIYDIRYFYSPTSGKIKYPKDSRIGIVVK